MANQINLSNRVQYLKSVNFSLLTREEKCQIKRNGRPLPNIVLKQTCFSKKKPYERKFNSELFKTNNWLCGCEETNALFCFPCLLFSKKQKDNSWSKQGVTDLQHLSRKITKHKISSDHLNCVIDLEMLGQINMANHMDSAYKQSIVKHNEQVVKNRDALSKIINIIKFCGKFELPLRGHDEKEGSENPGVFRGLVEYTCSLDSSLETHLNSSKVFKGTSKTIQNELLDGIMQITKEKIKEEVKHSDFLAVMIDETTDNFDVSQQVIVLRYELQGKPVERFWGFFNPKDATAESLSAVLLKELEPLIGDCPEKLIAQTYDGAAALSGIHTGVQTRIKEVYKNAHFIHCYAHQLNLILEKAASQNPSVRIFFSSLSGIPAFFHKSPQRMKIMDDIVGQRVPAPCQTRWTFKERTIESVYENTDKLIECCTILESSSYKDTVHKAVGIKRMLNDPEFIFWLNFFHKIMPHVNILYKQFQQRTFDAFRAQHCLNAFNSHIQKICDECHTLTVPPELIKRSFNINDLRVSAKEICDVIMLQCRERFSFTDHLEASHLLYKENFPKYIKEFPNRSLRQAVKAYPCLEEEALKTELTVLYTRVDIVLSKKYSLINLLQTLIDTNLQSSFLNTVKLLKILITTPMTSSEAERCFSTLKRIKTCLRATMMNERLSALAIITSENKLISGMSEFNEKVIDYFASDKNRRLDFIFK